MTPDPNRLRRVLALLARPGTEGEREAAMLAAGRLLAAAPGYWIARLAQAEPPPPPPPPRWAPVHWRDAAAEALEAENLTQWEEGFLESLSQRRRPLTPRQEEALAKICRRLGIDWP